MSYDAASPRTTKQRLPYPLNGTLFTTTRNISSEKPLPVVGDTMASELGTAYANSRIISVTDGLNQEKGILTISHVTIPTEAEQLASDWEVTDIPVGIGQMQGVVRSVISLASNFSESTPALNSALPVTGTGALFDGRQYVLFSRECVKSGMQLEPVFRVDKRTFVRKIPIFQNDFDEQLGGNLHTEQTLRHAAEIATGTKTVAEVFADSANAYWGLQSDGYEREGKQLAPEWFVITNRQVIPSGFLAGGRTYTTSIDFPWPAVLGSIDVESWERKDGGIQTYVKPLYAKEAYRGPCKATIVETFSATAPTTSTPTSMQPLPIDISTPMFSVAVGPTLHPAYSLSLTNGTKDPIFKYTAATFAFAATTPSAWPSSVIASDEVRPFRGGYLRSQITVHPPS